MPTQTSCESAQIVFHALTGWSHGSEIAAQLGFNRTEGRATKRALETTNAGQTPVDVERKAAVEATHSGQRQPERG
jgi:hypothetical protein